MSSHTPKRNSGQAIVIIHHRDNSGVWLNDCLKSIKTTYPILITNHEGNEWCMGAVKKMWETTGYNELFFMNESMVCKDNTIWDMVFHDYGGQSVMMSERYLMFFGKFRRQTVNQLEFPDVNSKYEDVILGEGKWCREYWELNDHVEIEPMVDPDTSNEDNFEEKHGRRNLVLENRYFKKWKSTYNMETLLANGLEQI